MVAKKKAAAKKKAPGRAKRTDPVAEKKQAFLHALGIVGTVRHACEAAGVGRSTAYEWRSTDEAFARAWEDAIEDVIEALEATAYQKAIAGDSMLTMFLLNAMRPDKYKHRSERRVTHRIEEEPEDTIERAQERARLKVVPLRRTG